MKEQEPLTVHGDVAKRDFNKHLHIHIHLDDDTDRDTIGYVIDQAIDTGRRWL